MSAIDQNTTRKIAKLARLKLTDAEIERYTQDLSQILTYVEKLKEVNTENVEPLVHGVPMPNHFREDRAEVWSEEQIKEMLSCSEQVLYEQYKVPQVIGEA